MDLKTAIELKAKFDAEATAPNANPFTVWTRPEFLEVLKYVQEHDPAEWDYYGKYLWSPLWKKIKRRVLKRDKKTCRRCGKPAKEVHHRSYDPEVLRGNNDEPLVSLCGNCHSHISVDEKGNKRPLEEQDRLLLEPPSLMAKVS